MAVKFEEAPLDPDEWTEFDHGKAGPVLDEVKIEGEGLFEELSRISIRNPKDKTLHEGDSRKVGIYKYTGMRGGQPAVRNDCSVLGFLSWVVHAFRRTNGRIFQHLKVKDDVYEAIKNICVHVKSFGNLADPQVVGKIWARAILGGELDDWPWEVDMRGKEMYSVIQHLHRHSSVFVETSCGCGIQTDKVPMVTVRGLAQLSDLQNLLDCNPACYIKSARCFNCEEVRKFVSITPAANTCLLYIRTYGMGNLEFEKFPLTVALGEDGYRLAYATYRIDITGKELGHQYSIHRIEGAFYLHEPLKSQYLTICQGKTVKEPEDEVHNLTGLFYYKL